MDPFLLAGVALTALAYLLAFKPSRRPGGAELKGLVASARYGLTSADLRLLVGGRLVAVRAPRCDALPGDEVIAYGGWEGREFRARRLYNLTTGRWS